MVCGALSPLHLLVSPETWGFHCPSWDHARVPCERLPSGNVDEFPDSPGLGLLSWSLSCPALAQVRVGSPPPECIYLFFRLPTLIEAQTLLTVALQLFSL